jgi:hypothetical protein
MILSKQFNRVLRGYLPALLLTFLLGLSPGKALFAQRLIPDEITPLPIDWLSFRAVPEAPMVQLNWTTTSDGQPVPFYVERSADGQQWSTIGSVPALGSKLSQVYVFQDSLPLNGTSYYRLLRWLQPDSPQVSPVESVHFEQPLTYLVNPNPVQGTLHLSLLSPSSRHLALRLFTRDGKAVKGQEWSLTATQTTLQWDVQGLPSGLYFLEIVDDRGTHPQKVLVL